MCFKNNKHFLGSTLIGFSIMIIVQLHLSFVLLVSILSSMLILKTIRMPNIAGIILGGLIGGLTLIPYFYHYFSATTTETASNASAFLFKNMMFNSDALFYFPKIFFRFLSFPTGETSRFIGRDSGIQATLIYIYDNPALWLPWLIGQIVTLYWIALGTKFYLQKSMEVIFKILRIKKEQKHPSDSIIHEKYSTLTFIVPFITYILFFFSIKEPSAHTYWILLPLAFFPVLENLTQDKRNDHFIPLLPSRLQILGLMVVTLCFLSYSLPGHLKEKNLKIYKVNTSTLSN
ncbi:MAG: hypothetical protein HY843_00755 [Bdellovibrio sp.]|nr:hypothetical protein [Bdellovibrio sp.]